MGQVERNDIKIHSDVPYVVKKEVHGLEKDNTIIVKNEKGLLNKLKRKFKKD